jgi:hypothetical protein
MIEQCHTCKKTVKLIISWRNWYMVSKADGTFWFCSADCLKAHLDASSSTGEPMPSISGDMPIDPSSPMPDKMADIG